MKKFLGAFALAAFATMLLGNDTIWVSIRTKIKDNINVEISGKIGEHLSELSDDELLEARNGLNKLKSKLGIDFVGTKVKAKPKRDDVEETSELREAISKLTDEELQRLRIRLSEGTISDDSLVEYLGLDNTVIGEGNNG